MTLHSFNCPNCGAGLQGAEEKLLQCRFCNATVRYAPRGITTPYPRPTTRFLQRADFSDPELPGWQLHRPDAVEFGKSHPSELRFDLSPTGARKPLLSTPNHFDNVEAVVNLRFLQIEGSTGDVVAGFSLRRSSGTYVTFSVSASGSFAMGGFLQKGEPWAVVVPWTKHPTLSEPSEPISLRAILKGDRAQFYINENLVVSTRVDGPTSGGVSLDAEVGSTAHRAVIGFVGLELREPS
jgi:hypothetical protein